ncbi:hypothetical protein LTR85_010235 [Meristemomyces frigidus]|nr:hypothetical protein LTR85_010235 [Meristemomyces frigidus]
MPATSLFERFLELPPELRNNLYTLHFAAHAKGHVVVRASALSPPVPRNDKGVFDTSILCAQGAFCDTPACTHRHPVGNADPTNVLLACKRVYHESIGLFVHTSTFLFRTPEDLRAFSSFAKAGRQTLSRHQPAGVRAVMSGAVRSIILATGRPGVCYRRCKRTGVRSTTSRQESRAERQALSEVTSAEVMLRVAAALLPALERIEIQLDSSIFLWMYAIYSQPTINQLSQYAAALLPACPHAERLAKLFREHAAADCFPRLTEVKVQDGELGKARRRLEDEEKRAPATISEVDWEAGIGEVDWEAPLALWASISRIALTAQLKGLQRMKEVLEETMLEVRASRQAA